MLYRIIVAGGRDFNNKELLTLKLTDWIINLYLSRDWSDEAVSIEFISGNASGADKLGEEFAKEYLYPLKLFPAEWNKYGKAAGPIRNKQMAEYASESDKGVLFAFWDGKSRGTKNMIDNATQLGLEIYIVKYSN